MKYFIKRMYVLLVRFGINPIAMWKSIAGLPFFIKDVFVFFWQKHKSDEKQHFSFGLVYPILDERFQEGGSASGHYFHQDLLVAQRVFKNNPTIHLDIGSRVDGFVAHVASFRKIEVLDVRSTETEVSNVLFKTADLMQLNESLIDYCDSLSCLHALEHFGLGRYNDPVKYDGYLDGLNSMYQILKTGGKLYVSVPIGRQRVEFNAHRVFSMPYLLNLFDGKYIIDHFSYVDDNGDLHKNVAIGGETGISKNFNCSYGCGIFEMTKI
jgi:predicted SAM-dependent methyltransferase